MGKKPDYIDMRQRMINQDLKGRDITSENVLKAFSRVPREQFIDEDLWEVAYEDYPLEIGDGQTISQPYIVAFMTESLRLKGHEKVLEIGTGSGYQTAILAELSKTVCSVERIENLHRQAKRALAGLGYQNIYFLHGNGTYGWKDQAPFDAIMVTAAAKTVPTSLLDQLSSNGKMIIPVGGSWLQTLLLIEKKNGKITETDLGGCRFVPLISGNS